MRVHIALVFIWCFFLHHNTNNITFRCVPCFELTTTRPASPKPTPYQCHYPTAAIWQLTTPSPTNIRPRCYPLGASPILSTFIPFPLTHTLAHIPHRLHTPPLVRQVLAHLPPHLSPPPHTLHCMVIAVSFFYSSFFFLFIYYHLLLHLLSFLPTHVLSSPIPPVFHLHPPHPIYTPPECA